MLPAEAVRLKAGKIAVAGDPDAALGDRQRGVLRVCDEFARRTRRTTESRHIVEMGRRGHREAAARMRRHLLDDERHRKWCRVRIDPWMCDDPDEPHGDEHAQRERLSTVDKGLQPPRLCFVPGFVPTMRVDEDVHVGHQHRYRSRSRSSFSSATAKSDGSWCVRLPERP